MKKRIYAALFAIGIALVTGCMSLEEIKAAQEKAKVERFTAVKKRADSGDGRMAYQAGVMLEKGIGVKQDSKLAMTYYEKAVQAGIPPAAWRIMMQIYKTGDTEHSKLFGDCNQVLWNSFWTTKGADMERNWYKNKNYRRYRGCIAICLKYFDLLQKSGKDAEAYSLKKQLISIVCKKYLYFNGTSSISEEYESEKEIIGFFDKLTGIKTEAEPKALKYPTKDFADGIKLYKHIKSGITLEYFVWETLQKNGKIQSCGKGDYCQQYKSTIYPNVAFCFSSNRRNPNTGNIHTISEYYRLNRDWFDLKGVLFEIEISLPKKMDKQKVFDKLCQDYPQIKPTFEKKDMDRPAAGCVLKVKGGRYIWKTDDIQVSFTFADYAGVTGSNPRLVNMLKQEGQNFGVRQIVIRDKRLYKRFVTSKQEQVKAKENAAKTAEENSALNF